MTKNISDLKKGDVCEIFTGSRGRRKATLIKKEEYTRKEYVFWGKLIKYTDYLFFYEYAFVDYKIWCTEDDIIRIV